MNQSCFVCSLLSETFFSSYRSVSPEERSFALGMQFVIFRLLGYIPSPIVFGNVIDSSCLLWSVKRCSQLLPAVSGRCLLYDIQDFRYKCEDSFSFDKAFACLLQCFFPSRYVGMLSGLKLLALALFLYDLYQLRKIEKKEEEAEAATAAALEGSDLKNSNSIISLDKCKENKCASPSISIHSRNHPIDRSQSSVQEREPMISA